jgi:hypothetical protein
MLLVDFANTVKERGKVLHFSSAPAFASMNQREVGCILTNMATEEGIPAK